MIFDWLRRDFGSLSDASRQEGSDFLTMFTNEGIVGWKEYSDRVIGPTNTYSVQESDQGCWVEAKQSLV